MRRRSNLLTAAIKTQPSADAYLYLGISYGHTREWMRAEDTLKEGSSRYPQDPRFHNELAGVYLAVQRSRQGAAIAARALEVDPDNKYATDLLATVDMSMGKVRVGARRVEQRRSDPSSATSSTTVTTNFENWTVGKASAFRNRGKVDLGKMENHRSTAVGNAICMPTSASRSSRRRAPDSYTAVIRTTAQIQRRLSNSSFPYWKPWFSRTRRSASGTSGIQRQALTWVTGSRQTGIARKCGFLAPIPLPGILFL